jgi:cytochrome c-type biogenesis protein CcmH
VTPAAGASPPTPSPAGVGDGRTNRSRSSGAARFAGWVAMAVLLVGALFVGITDTGGRRSPEARERDVAASVACPTCDGQSVADSDASAARGLRTYIADRIAEGAGDDDIRAELADRYGDEILLTPGRTGLAGLVWILPVVALVVAFAGLALTFRRWQARSTTRASDADRLLVRQAQSSSERPAGPDDTP